MRGRSCSKPPSAACAPSPSSRESPFSFSWALPSGLPQAVTLAGWLHGLLFMAFCIVLTQAHQECRWTFARSGTVLLAALLTFGPFVLDARLRREDQELQVT